ncbi:MAG: transcription antitermination factor NusB [Alphaproteobacteria bacterium]|nr:transcription antitermination factor NusB [Alphaproteobacteria bacterium]
MSHPPEHSAKRLARLAAVQGLYQIALTHRLPNEVIKDFLAHPATFLQDAGDNPAVDAELFDEIVSGVTRNNEALDEMLAGALDAKVSANRIEILLRATLRAGAYELHHHGSVPAGVIINDYVDVAHAFFNAKEPGLVNAVLDKLAKNLRS